MLSWVEIAWSVVAASALTLAAEHLLIGIRQRSRSNLFFAATGISVVVIALFELALMDASSPADAGRLIRWLHVPIFTVVASLVLFVRAYLRAGRAWLGAAVVGSRAVALLVNFLHAPNLNFVEITGLRRVRFLGEDVAVVQGVVSRWTRLGELCSLLLIVFLSDATVAVWRRGERRRAAALGGSTIFFVAIATGTTSLVHARLLAVPYLISLPFAVLLVVMSYEMASDVIRAAELSRDLQASRGALRESDRRLVLATDAANVGVWTWDVAPDEIWMTPKLRALCGYPPEERLDFHRFLAVLHPEDRGRVEKAIRRALETGGEFEGEYRVLRPDREIRWIVGRGAAERDAVGGALRVRGVSIDVTRRKAAEVEAARRQAELAHLSRVTMLGELSGSLAHELNQPLAAILSNAQAALRFLERSDADPEEMRQILADIVADDRRAGEVIRRLRLLLRKGEVHFEPLSVADVVEDVLRLIHSDLVNRGVTAAIDIAPDLPAVRGDRVQIEQVLLNLVTNACDAMAAEDQSRKRLLLRAVRNDGVGVRLSVQDGGHGMSTTDLERVFEPFVSTKSHGMGLGLTVCRTIVAAHGGRLWAENNAGPGATFHLTLPTAGVEPS